jgi:hypothetical protein
MDDECVKLARGGCLSIGRAGEEEDVVVCPYSAGQSCDTTHTQTEKREREREIKEEEEEEESHLNPSVQFLLSCLPALASASLPSSSSSFQKVSRNESTLIPFQ